MNSSKITGAVSAVALVLSLAALTLGVSLASSVTTSAGDSWRGPPKIWVMSQLEYMRVDGVEFRVGEGGLTRIETVGLVGRWGEFEFTYDDRTELLRIHLDNIQIYVPKDVPKKPQSDDNSNGGG